jgi:DNA mismatch repair protein MutL
MEALLRAQEDLVSQMPAVAHPASRCPHSLAAALEECVLNSLEAGSTEILASVDAAALSFSVSDNGQGVAPGEDFRHLGVAAASSKRFKAGDLQDAEGVSRGESLASLCRCAVVSISSRARGRFDTHRRILSEGRLVRDGLDYEQRGKQGTVVEVKDLFFNVPARRKAVIAAG